MLDQIQLIISNLIMNKKFLLVIFIAIIFILASIYVYKTYVSSKLDSDYVDNKEFSTTTTSMNNSYDSVDLYFFGVPWCPHSKKAASIWEDIKIKYQDKKINDKKINFIQVDCDQDPELADKFKIEGYPTIKLIKDNQVIEYDAKPEKDTLMQFLNSTI